MLKSVTVKTGVVFPTAHSPDLSRPAGRDEPHGGLSRPYTPGFAGVPVLEQERGAFPWPQALTRRPGKLYEFGPFRLDPEKELLLREDETVPIAPKAFQILLVLIRHNKQVVTKDDLMKTIWPDTFVEEPNLSRTTSPGKAPASRRITSTSSPCQARLPLRKTRSWCRTANSTLLPRSINGELRWKRPGPGDGSPPRQSFSSWWPPAPGNCSSIAHRCLLKKTPSCSPTSRIPPAIRSLMAHSPGLAVQLEQSPFLSLISDERIRQTPSPDG